jgi:hypothetical protein
MFHSADHMVSLESKQCLRQDLEKRFCFVRLIYNIFIDVDE